MRLESFVCFAVRPSRRLSNLLLEWRSRQQGTSGEVSSGARGGSKNESGGSAGSRAATTNAGAPRLLRTPDR